ncbi:MAG: amino acid adenylation domain-containing protein, partial [Gordonia sp.]|uniref:non-ribosomal peptide synthetase n=1 Tax=Gordonia sp. (in: high G+C Gram-positive bacteria) TaxID=84139 RepID=UPI001D541668
PLPVQFADFAIWQHEVLGSADDAESVIGRQLGYWKDKLTGLPDVLDLPADRPRPAVESHRGARVPFEIPGEVGDRIEALARERGMTPFMVMHAAFAVLLARLSTTDDIAVATPVAGRGDRVLDPLVGMFVNTLVLRTQVDPGESFAGLLDRVRGTDLDAFGHAELPFETLVEALNPVRSEAFAPLSQVMLSFDPGASANDADVSLGDLTITPVTTPLVTAQLDLSVEVWSATGGGAWTGSAEYATDLFDEVTVAEFMRRFTQLLDGLTADPDAAVGDAGMLDAAASDRVLSVSHGPVLDVPDTTTVAAITARIAAIPDVVAVEFEGRQVTYAELGSRINLLARELISSGVGPDTAVGICVERSVEMMVAIHAVLAAGGQFVPIDTEAPADRVEYMLSIAGASVVLLTTADDERFSAVRTVVVDCSGPVDMSAPAITDDDRIAPVRPDNAAYTLFTSGSTGRPKGVTVSHAALSNMHAWFGDVVGERDDHVVIVKTPYTFDASELELVWPLTVGARVVMMRPDGHLDPRHMLDMLADHQVTWTQFVPSALSVFLEVKADAGRELPALRTLITGGEALPVPVAETVQRALPGVDIVNQYGPTEATVQVTEHVLRPGDATVPIGRTGANTSLLVLDSRLHPVPVGVSGELYTGGVQVARGYAAQPALTAERFVADPFGEPGTRLYRTGDLVRWNAAGELEYLGRTDFQVKLRGQRLELGEVESVLAGAPGVVNAAVIVAATESGVEHLVAYIAPDTADLDTVKAVAQRSLPAYMVPSVWMPLAQMPLSSAEKADRKALPAPVFDAVTEAYTAPETDTEIALARAFADVLGVERVGVTSSFFDLGGNSLSAMRLAARASDVLGVEVSVRDAFGAPSVRELIAAVAGNASSRAPIVAVDPRPERIPLSFAQRRMWFVNQRDTTSIAYNIPTVLRITGDLDAGALHRAFVDLVVRHEALRTTFPSHGGAPYQQIAAASTVPQLLDWAVSDSAADMESAVSQGFDVTNQWPIRIRLVSATPGEHLLAVIVHHIASDGESVTPMLTDLITAYTAENAGHAPVFRPLAVQYADVALWQHEHLGSPDDPASVVGRQLGYWREQLAGLPDVVEIPTDRPRPPRASGRGAQVGFTIPAATAARIDEVSAQAGVTPFMVVHTALAVLLARLSSTSDIAIGTPVGGRGQTGLDPLIGMFVNTLILRTGVEPGASFEQILVQAKSVDLDAFANADIPFDEVVEACNVVRSDAFAPFTQVWLTFEQTALPELAGSDLAVGDVAGLRIESLAAGEVPARIDLLVAVSRNEDSRDKAADWTGSIIYATDLFDESTVESFTGNLLRILDAGLGDPGETVGSITINEGPSVAELAKVARARATEQPVVSKDIADSDAAVISGPGTAPVLLGQMFADVAAKSGKRPAVIDATGTTLTYGQLDERSSRLARWLIARGIGAESLVALAIGRSAALLTAIWAVAKTGAGYVPIDPDYPADRVANMVEDSGAILGLTAGDTGDLPGDEFAWVRIDDPAVAGEIDGCDAAPVASEELVRPVRTDNVAYVIYTSGSTGRPKGVSVTHSGLANFAAEEIERAGVDRYSRVLGFASPSFDASVLEYLMATRSGSVLVYRPSDAVGGEVLQEYMARQGITHTFLTPTVLSTLDPEALFALRVVYAGGEAVSAALKDEWAACRRIQNLYGPTETTIGVAISEPMEIGEPVSLGGPIEGVALMVLDSRLRPVPVGVTGELYVAGRALSRGYLDRPGLTADRFVANPHSGTGDRMYRTGDVVRWQLDESGAPVIEYSGRNDDQVKLRGLRIELGEIEAVLNEHPDLHSAVVIGVGGQVATALAAYVVRADTDADIDIAEVKRFVGERLPAHMVPASITVLDSLPLTPVGKLDKAALPEPVIEAAEYIAPESAAEEAAVAAFAEILGVDRVSVTESFFDIGGNSLSATRVAGRVSAALGVEVTLRDVFEAPSVRELVAAVAGHSAALPQVAAVVPRPERVPLSFAQQRMWFLSRFDPESPTYNIPAVVRLAGALDVGALRAAIVDVLVRHEVLRTTFPDVDGAPHQLIAAPETVTDELDWQVVDSAAEIESSLLTGFDLTRHWPVRFRLLRDGESYVFAAVAHHIAADGESMPPLLTDIVTAYAARAEGRTPEFAPLPVQFADYAIWQHDVLGSPDDPESVVGQQLAYWAERLAGLPDVLELPTDRPRPPIASQRGAAVTLTLPEELTAGIDQLGIDADVTPFMVFHAALATLLSRLSGADDIAVGTSVAGRGQAELDPLVGMFVNTLVLRTQVDGGRPFGDLLRQVRDTDLEGYAHAELPFEALVEALSPARSEAFAPLVQVLLFFSNGQPAQPVSVSDITVTPLEAPTTTARVDLTVGVAAAPGQPWELTLEYATDLFDESTMRAFGERLVTLLEQVVADPARAAGDYTITVAADTAADPVEWGARVQVPAGTVADVVAAAIAKTPEATALWFEGREVSYREFGARVNTLARRLIEAGVGPESAVAVRIPRSVEMMVAIHAVIAAGGQYVPIGLDTPDDRVEYMLETAGVSTMLTGADGPAFLIPEERSRELASRSRHEGSGESSTWAGDIQTLIVDCSSEVDLSTPPVTDSERLSPLRIDHAVYTLFTSGSTGRPKGVTLTHDAVVNRLWWGLDELPIDASDTVVQKTPYTFDCSVPELFAPLMIGAKLVVLRDGGHLDPLYVADVIERTGATMVHFVPSMLSVFADIVGHERVSAMSSTVRIISTTGEALPPALAGQVRSWLPDVLFYNLYGPTEAAVEITYEKIEAVSGDEGSVPIGVPVWNSSAVVLDARLHRVPDGVPGELYLGGIQLARGYAARGDLTADRFIADPYGEPGTRLYRTGDLVRRRRDGVLEYLGRTDFQVKLRGQRIELGEIESVLASAPGVVHAAATVADGPGGSQHLVGYLSGGPGRRPDVETVKSLAEQSLPVYMVPTVWVVLDDITLNSAGKLDRKALPEPDFADIEAEYVAPESDTEVALAQVYADLLGVERVGVTESFFDIGGNSLSAMRLAARAAEVLGVEVSVRDIFDAPSVRELIVATIGRGAALAPITKADPRPARIPLSFAQQRMWFINQLDPALPTYNIPAVLRLTGDLDVAALRQAVIDTVERHEVLRTTFPIADGLPYQRIDDIALFDSRGVWQTVDTDDDLFAAVASGFDVTSGWPIRVALRASVSGDYLLGVVLHHIGADGESMLPLVTDIVTAYTARAQGDSPQWTPLEVQFADFAIWQHEALGSVDDAESVTARQLGYWREQLAGLPDVLELPADRPRPQVASYRGADLEFAIPADIADGVSRVASSRDVTPFMVVHAAFAALLARMAATNDIAVATPVAGRGQAVLDPLVGMFVNTLVLRTAIESSMSFAQLLDRVRVDDLDAFDHADVPFESVVEAIDPVRSEAFAPLAQVMLSFDPGASVAGAQVSLAGLEIAAVEPPLVAAQLDLRMVVASADAGNPWSGAVTYATDLFDESTVGDLADRFVRLLGALVADPAVSIGDAPLLDPAERTGLVDRSVGAGVVVPAGSVADAVAAQVVRSPDASALWFEGRSVSYAELSARVSVLARELI